MSSLEAVLRGLGPLLLAAGTAWASDRGMVRRQLAPPGFAQPWRRAAALSLLTVVLWVGMLAGLGTLGLDGGGPDLEQLGPLELFGMHVLLVFTLGAWYLLGFAGLAAAAVGTGTPDTDGPAAAAGELLDGQVVVAGVPRCPAAASWWVQFGWHTPTPRADVGIGLAAGVVIWVAVLAVMAAVAVLIAAFGGEAILPKRPPALVAWLALQPFLLRVALAISAGVVEETFFRGFLEPRLGVGATTVLFVLAHLSYDQPWMLVGVTLLSLGFSALCRWRRTIVPAVIAHTVFDAIQLLIAIPAILELGGGAWPVAAAG